VGGVLVADRPWSQSGTRTPQDGGRRLTVPPRRADLRA
jgi:hypothetical protein